jgi:hypothetical protein
MSARVIALTPRTVEHPKATPAPVDEKVDAFARLVELYEARPGFFSSLVDVVAKALNQCRRPGCRNVPTYIGLCDECQLDRRNR